jgi:hypothetical protein
MSTFQPLTFDSAKVGKIFKSSKIRSSWKFLLDGLDYTVVLFYSRISSKVKVLVNGEIALNTKAVESQYYRFNIRYRPMVIVKIGDGFDLRYGNVSSSAVLSGRQSLGKRENLAEQQENKTKSVQLRRSLPCAMPKDIPQVNFRKQVKDADLLGMGEGSRNPFDMCEEEEFEIQARGKTENGFNNNQVPWPRGSQFAFTSN